MFALFSSDECYTASSQISDQGQEGTEEPTLQMVATHTAKLGSQTEKPQLSGSYTVDQGGGVLVPQLNKETGFPHVLRNSLWEHSGRESYVHIFHTQCQHLPSNQRKALPPPTPPPGLTQGGLCHSHGPETLESLTWLCSCQTIHVQPGLHLIPILLCFNKDGLQK